MIDQASRQRSGIHIRSGIVASSDISDPRYRGKAIPSTNPFSGFPELTHSAPWSILRFRFEAGNTKQISSRRWMAAALLILSLENCPNQNFKRTIFDSHVLILKNINNTRTESTFKKKLGSGDEGELKSTSKGCPNIGR